MTPRRQALVIGALLLLSLSMLVGSGRYPDEEFGLTIEQANALLTSAGGASLAKCPVDAPDPERPCTMAHTHNFPARARVIGGGTAAAVALSAIAFRRRYDLDAG